MMVIFMPACLLYLIQIINMQPFFGSNLGNSWWLSKWDLAPCLWPRFFSLRISLSSNSSGSMLSFLADQCQTRHNKQCWTYAWKRSLASQGNLSCPRKAPSPLNCTLMPTVFPSLTHPFSLSIILCFLLNFLFWYNFLSCFSPYNKKKKDWIKMAYGVHASTSSPITNPTKWQ